MLRCDKPKLAGELLPLHDSSLGWLILTVGAAGDCGGPEDRLKRLRECTGMKCRCERHSGIAKGNSMKLQERMQARAWRTGLAGAGLLALSACGGGGSSNVRVDPPPSPPPAEVPDPGPQPDFDAHLVLTNTKAAHAAGFTGKGVTIGLLDSGIRRDHPTLAGRVKQSFIYLDPKKNNVNVDDVVGHGTTVAQLAGGTAFGQWPGGIAPGANFVSARIIGDTPPKDDGSGKGNEVTDGSWLGTIHADLISAGARISNNSWGGLYWNGDNVTRTFINAMKPFVVDWGGLVVFATGNESFDDPSDTASLPSQGAGADILERGWLAVAALDTLQPTKLADYSNACGLAMNYCLVAPGYVVFTDVNDPPDKPSYWVGKGTSFAAPQVAGAAALVWEAFPYFNNDLVRQTLLGTAVDLGAPGVDAVFGHGLLDVGKAVQGPGRLDWGQVTAAFNGGLSTWSNPISGAGGITKAGDGHLDLTGDNTYRGKTVVQAGTLSSLHDLPGAVEVRASGLLLLDDISVRGSLRNEGISMFYGGGSDGAVHAIDGAFSQTATGVLAFDIGSRLQVAGRADIAGTVKVTGITDGYIRSARETFLTADAGVFGTFSGWSTASGVFLDANLGYDANNVWFDIARLDVSATAQSLGLTAAAVGSAVRVENAFQIIDGGQTGTIGPAGPGGLGGFIGGAAAIQSTSTAAAAERSLASLSGESHAADTSFAMMAMEDSRHALESRLDALGSSGNGIRAGAWANRLGGERSMWSHTRLDANGWMLGHDRKLGEHLMVGGAFGQTDGYAHSDLRRDREHNRQYEGQLYAAWNADGNYLLGRLAAGRMDRQMQREILLGADRYGVGADYANRYTSLGLQAGHRFAVAGGTLTPYLGTETLQLDRGAFAEQGAVGFGLSTDGSRLQATRALVGTRIEQQWRFGKSLVSVQGRLEWQRLLSQSGSAIDARFTGVEAWSPISGAGLGEEATVFGVGLRTRLPVGQLGFDLDARRELGQTWTGASANWSVGF
jgi:autotransporter-associated beta strand protein